jgi:hypothetical protein
LGWEVTITGGNAEEECIVALEGLGIDDGDIRFGRSVHLEERSIDEEPEWQRRPYLGQNFLRESLRDLEDIGFDAGLLETFLLSFGELLNVSTMRRGC